MPTYEQNREAEEAERTGKPVQLRTHNEPNLRRVQHAPGAWEWIVVPDDEYPVVAEAPTAAKVKVVMEQSTPDASGPIMESDMTVRKESLLKAFEAREGSIREKVIKMLVSEYNRPVPTKLLLKAAYGKQDDENVGALRNVLKGVDVMIKKNKLPVTLEHVKDENVNGYGLFAR